LLFPPILLLTLAGPCMVFILHVGSNLHCQEITMTMYTSDIMEQVLKQLGGIAQFQADIMACLMGGKNAIVPNKGISILI